VTDHSVTAADKNELMLFVRPITILLPSFMKLVL